MLEKRLNIIEEHNGLDIKGLSLHSKWNQSSFFFEDYLVDLVASYGQLSLVLAFAKEGVDVLVLVVEVRVGDSEVAEDEVLSRPEADLAVSEEQVVLVVGNCPHSFLQLIDIAGVEDHDEGVFSETLRFEGLIGVAGNHSAVFQFDQYQNMRYFVDVAMEVDLIERVKFEQKARGFDVEVVSVFDGVDDCLFVEAIVIEDIVGKVSLIVSLIADLLHKFFVLSDSVSLFSICFGYFQLQGSICLFECLYLAIELLHFLCFFSFFFLSFLILFFDRIQQHFYISFSLVQLLCFGIIVVNHSKSFVQFLGVLSILFHRFLQVFLKFINYLQVESSVSLQILRHS